MFIESDRINKRIVNKLANIFHTHVYVYKKLNDCIYAKFFLYDDYDEPVDIQPEFWLRDFTVTSNPAYKSDEQEVQDEWRKILNNLFPNNKEELTKYLTMQLDMQLDNLNNN